MFEWLVTRDPTVVYLFLLLSSFLESIIPPYPSDIFVLLFSFAASQGNFNPYFVYLFTVLGSSAGIMFIYYIGRTKGDSLMRLLSRSILGRVISRRFVEQAKRKYERSGTLIILLNRFLPGMRAPLGFAAGLIRINVPKVFFLSTISICLWNFFLVILGYYVGVTWQDATRFLRNYTTAVVLALLGIMFVFSSISLLRRGSREKS
jgi:membrane protein DedA with SNARE-associated domain